MTRNYDSLTLDELVKEGNTAGQRHQDASAWVLHLINDDAGEVAYNVAVEIRDASYREYREYQDAITERIDEAHQRQLDARARRARVAREDALRNA